MSHLNAIHLNFQGLSVPLLAAALFESESIDHTKINQRGIKVTSTIIAILLDAFGIFVARTYSTVGLRIVCIIS